MPINAYVGLSGHGKTYEVVESIVLPAVIAGRRIVTNLYGLRADAIEAFVLETTKAIVKVNIRLVSNDEIESPKFLYHGKEGVETISKAGDLVIVDEAWRIWDGAKAIVPEHFIFFREHRHYVDPVTGVSSDLVVITQDIADLHRKLKGVIERTFVMRKVKEFGQTNFYTVHQYERARVARRFLINHWRKVYDPKVFDLYKSYSVQADGQAGLETVLDKRQNLLKSGRVWTYIALVMFMGSGSLFFLNRFFHGGYLGDKKPAAGETVAESVKAGDTPAAKAAAVVKAGGVVEPETDYRIVGVYSSGAELVIVMRSGAGRFRYVYDVPNFRLRGLDVGVVLDGKAYTNYAGGEGQKGLLK